MTGNQPEYAHAGRIREPGERLSLNERLMLIGLIDEGMRQGSLESPVTADLFSDLWDLVNETASGSKIDRLRPEDSRNGFREFEINAETGETLGRLNMLYLKKPIPCYYLVYVEVSGPYRRKGLGNRIIAYFRDFLIRKSAVGILDNIIPRDDPTYDIYFKQAWEPVEAVIGETLSEEGDNYMVYIPPRLQGKDIRESIIKLVYHIKRKRAAIDMRDNEVMVQRTIAEFKDLFAALLSYFEREIEAGDSSPFMRFMFTRFVTKLIAFRRRIGDLIGYTGGDSLEQLKLAPQIAAMPVQTYAPFELAGTHNVMSGDMAMWSRLPEALKKQPARFIDALPNYKRPSFVEWLKHHGTAADGRLTIGDLMDLGFDPTRLKEITIDDENFVFERIQSRQVPELVKKKVFLERAGSEMIGVRARNAQIKTNPPLLVMGDEGNAYILRRKIDGIHWDEAVEQLQSVTHLKGLNTSLKLDSVVKSTVSRTQEAMATYLSLGEGAVPEDLAFFVSWDLKNNRPKLCVDAAGTSLESVWLA